MSFLVFVLRSRSHHSNIGVCLRRVIELRSLALNSHYGEDINIHLGPYNLLGIESGGPSVSLIFQMISKMDQTPNFGPSLKSST